jgi:hypothetical protein
MNENMKKNAVLFYTAMLDHNFDEAAKYCSTEGVKFVERAKEAQELLKKSSEQMDEWEAEWIEEQIADMTEEEKKQFFEEYEASKKIVLVPEGEPEVSEDGLSAKVMLRQEGWSGLSVIDFVLEEGEWRVKGGLSAGLNV